MLGKESILKRILQNARIAKLLNEIKLDDEQLTDALPILIDMFNEVDDKKTPFLTSIRVTDGNVERIKVMSTHQKNFAYLDNVVTQHIERIDFEDSKKVIPEEGRKDLTTELDSMLKKNRVVNYGLYIYGEIGIGKTFLLKKIAREFALLERKVGFIKISTLVDKIKKTFSSLDEQKELIFQLKNVDYLFIDDLGSETIAAWFRDDVLFNILDWRCEKEKPTFFTSHYSLDKLMEIQSRTAKQTFRDWDKAKRLVSRIRNLSKSIHLKGANKRYQTEISYR